jgi:hypothetical protein
MANLQEQLVVQLQTTEISTSNVVSTQSDSYSNSNLTSMAYSDFAVTGGTGVETQIPLPFSPAHGIYLKNLSSTAGQGLTVKITPAGGAEAVAIVLQPGGCLVYFDTLVTSNGFTQISVTAISGATNYAYKIFG